MSDPYSSKYRMDVFKPTNVNVMYVKFLKPKVYHIDTTWEVRAR